MFCCRYCPCCYYAVIIPGYYFLSLLFLLLLCFYHSWLLLLAVVVMVVLITSCQPSQCCCRIVVTVLIIPGHFVPLLILMLCCYHSWALCFAVVIVLVVIVIIPGYYFLSLLLWLFSLLLASPANVVAVAALCLSLANKVDVVAHRLATRHVLPLAGVVPTVAHHNAVLGDVCCWVVAHPARIVTVRASIAPNPSALGSAVSKSNECLATCSYCCLNCCVLVCGRDNCQPQVAFVRATGRRIAPTGLTFPQNVAFSSVGVLRIPTRTCCITRAASALSSVPLSTRSEVVDVTA